MNIFNIENFAVAVIGCCCCLAEQVRKLFVYQKIKLIAKYQSEDARASLTFQFHLRTVISNCGKHSRTQQQNTSKRCTHAR